MFVLKRQMLLSAQKHFWRRLHNAALYERKETHTSVRPTAQHLRHLRRLYLLWKEHGSRYSFKRNDWLTNIITDWHIALSLLQIQWTHENLFGPWNLGIQKSYRPWRILSMLSRLASQKLRPSPCLSVDTLPSPPPPLSSAFPRTCGQQIVTSVSSHRFQRYLRGSSWAVWIYLDEVIQERFAGHVTVDSVVSIQEIRFEMLQQRVQVH